MAFEQVSESGSRWRRAADSPPERIQDRQSHDPGAHFLRGAGEPVQRIRMDATFSRRRQSGANAQADGANHRPMHPGYSLDPKKGPERWKLRLSALADGHSPHPERLDLSERSGRS